MYYPIRDPVPRDDEAPTRPSTYTAPTRRYPNRVPTPEPRGPLDPPGYARNPGFHENVMRQPPDLLASPADIDRSRPRSSNHASLVGGAEQRHTGQLGGGQRNGAETRERYGPGDWVPPSEPSTPAALGHPALDGVNQHGGSQTEPRADLDQAGISFGLGLVLPPHTHPGHRELHYADGFVPLGPRRNGLHQPGSLESYIINRQDTRSTFSPHPDMVDFASAAHRTAPSQPFQPVSWNDRYKPLVARDPSRPAHVPPPPRSDRVPTPRGGPPKAILGGVGGKTWEERTQGGMIASSSRLSEGTATPVKGKEASESEVNPPTFKGSPVVFKPPPSTYHPPDSPEAIHANYEIEGEQEMDPRSSRTKAFPWPVKEPKESPEKTVQVLPTVGAAEEQGGSQTSSIASSTAFTGRMRLDKGKGKEIVVSLPNEVSRSEKDCPACN
jgi:hypothetical protein